MCFYIADYKIRLEKHYNNLSQVNITPWDPDNTVHIDDIYTELFWVRDNRKPSGKKEEKLDDYSDVLREQKSNSHSNRFLVYGIPGIGKSTFARKIALDWARGKKEILKKFDLLLMIPLRNVCDSTTFRNILIEAKLFPAEDQRYIDSLNRYILDHQDKVLLVLDGFDEYSATGNSPVVHRIWIGDELRECFVILTTRPVKEDDTKRFSHAQFQIKGFNWDRIKEFAIKMLEDEKKVEMFLNYIKKHTLMEIAEIPLLLLMLCLVWKEKDREALPEAKVHLYKEFIQTLFNHMAAKGNEEKFERIGDYEGDLEKVGELAFKTLLSNSLEFDYENFPTELLSSKLLTVGVIQIVKLFSAKPKKKIAFLHKSIQEFLAAWFIIHRLIPSSKDGLSCMPAIDSTRKVVDFLEVFKFVCEWSPEGSIAVLQHLDSLRKSQNPSEDETLFLDDLSDDDRKLLKLTLECFIATPNESKADVYPSLLKSVSGVLVIPDTLLPRVADGHIVKSDTLPNCVLFDFQRHPALKDRDYMASIMDDLNSVIVMTSEEGKASDFVRRQTKSEVLASLFLKGKEDEMCLHFSQISSVVIGALGEATPPTMDTIVQTPTDHEDTRGSDEATRVDRLASRHCFSLAKKIDIDEIHGDMVISNVMPLLTRPREVALRSFHESSQPKKIEALVSGISITERLQRLRLHKICLTAQFLPVLTDDFHKASNLEELYLSENPLGSSIRCLADNLHHLQQLTVLELSNVRMDERAFSDLANSLYHVPHLKVLSVSRNQLGTSISELADNLEYIPHLTDLELSDTKMDEEGARSLAKGLQFLSKLENLDISHNPLGSAVVVIAENLFRAACLTELNMNDTKMGVEEITELTSYLRSFQTLRTLSVGYNPLAQGVCDLVENLCKVSKLKRLNMENVEMDEEEVDRVKTAWKRNQSLTIANDYFDEKGEPKKGRSVEALPNQQDQNESSNFANSLEKAYQIGGPPEKTGNDGHNEPAASDGYFGYDDYDPDYGGYGGSGGYDGYDGDDDYDPGYGDFDDYDEYDPGYGDFGDYDEYDPGYDGYAD